MNKRRMEAVLRRIKAEPKRWYQGDWHRNPDNEPCHTQHCIAGWAQCLMRGDPKGKGTHNSFGAPNDAKRYLELTEEQASYLFFKVQRVSQIERFIKTGGKVPKPKVDPEGFVL